ncbi:MAG: hypothetical protein BroJett021_31460 [Chloroflexota bacterium]|nr:hypothetical protein [Caldilinea sp.]GIK74158.1 MAG: hypothetical protein BroJett021_31460 [Chloroflexota bacterium]
MHRTPNPILQHLLALALYFIATVVFTWPLALNLTTAIPGDSFDGWQNYWNLWWIKQALVERATNPLFTDQLYYPTGVTLYFHTLNPFNGLATLPIQLVFGLIPAYNAVVFISWVLAGYGMFLLARWVIAEGERGRGEDREDAAERSEEIHPNPPDPRNPRAIFFAPLVAGLVYTLSPFHMAHLLGHMQVMSLQWMPFYILALLRSLHLARNGQPWLRAALFAGLFLILTGLCDWYFVLYLFLFTVVTVLWQWLTPSGRIDLRKLLRVLAPPAVAGSIFAVALSFWLVPMVIEATRFRFMVRPSADLYILSASVMDFLIPNRLHTLFRPDSFGWPGNQIAPVSERTIAIGYTALALALTALTLAWRRAAFWWVMAIFFFALALGPQIHLGDITWDDIPDAALQGEELASWTPYGVVNELVPFMRISRSVSRFAVMVQLCMAVLAAIGLWRLLAVMRNSISHYSMSALIIAALLFEYWVAPYPLSPPDTPAYYADLAADPDGRAVLNLPMNYDRPGYLLYQTVHGKPLTVAYISRDDPRTLTERTPVLQHFRHLGPDILAVDPAAVASTVFGDLDIGTVVLDRYKMPGGDERTYTEELASAIFAGQTPIFEDERITVYRVAPNVAATVTPQPYLMLGALDWGPLERGADAVPHRTLQGGRAEVIVMHPPATGAVTLRYASDASATVSVLVAGDDAVLATSAGSAGEVRIDLAEALRVARIRGLPESPLSLRIVVDGDAPVRVEGIALVE